MSRTASLGLWSRRSPVRIRSLTLRTARVRTGDTARHPCLAALRIRSLTLNPCKSSPFARSEASCRPAVACATVVASPKRTRLTSPSASGARRAREEYLAALGSSMRIVPRLVRATMAAVSVASRATARG